MTGARLLAAALCLCAVGLHLVNESDAKTIFGAKAQGSLMSVPNLVSDLAGRTIQDYTPLDASVALITIQMSDNTQWDGTVSFGPPFNDNGGIYSLTQHPPLLLINPAGPGVGSQGGNTNHVTVVATTLAGVSRSLNIDIPVIAAPTVVNATSFTGAHAGTTADPYPLEAVKTAVESLPAAGGTVILADGVWRRLVNAPVDIFRGNFHLHGNSLAAKVELVDQGSLHIKSATPIYGIRVSNILFDGHISTEARPFQMLNTHNSSVTGCTFWSYQTGDIAVFAVEGGSEISVLGNTYVPGGGAGGVQIQINPLGGTSNAGFHIKGNTGDSVGMLLIGINSALIENNTLRNDTMGNAIGISLSPSLGTIDVINTNGVTLDNNLINAYDIAVNNATLTGLTQDPGTIGAVKNFRITNNTIKGGVALIGVNGFEDSCLDTCTPSVRSYYTTILNNHLVSFYAGSTINIRGGTDGITNGILVQGNILDYTGTPPPIPPNQIKQDATTFNAVLIGNTFNP